MKVTEVTPPQERKFTLELSESELWQLRAILGVLDGGMLGEAPAWEEINAALGVTPEIEDKWYLTATFDQTINRGTSARVGSLYIDRKMGDKV